MLLIGQRVNTRLDQEHPFLRHFRESARQCASRGTRANNDDVE
jgi:hypothetical protein